MQISVAILGGGIFATEAYLPAIKLLQNQVILRAVYSRTEATASEFSKIATEILALESPLPVYYDASQSHNLDVLLARDDIQAIIVCLPITTQPDVVRKALAAGKHVLSEKPVSKDVADGLTLIEEYQAKYKPKGLIWRVAENFEAEPAIQAAGKAIRDGVIGKVLFWNISSVSQLGTDSKYYKTWRITPGYQGGFLFDSGVHSAAILRVILPSPLTRLTGFTSLNKEHLAPQDTIQAVIQSEDGSHGIFELSFAAPSSSAGRIWVIVTGSEGSLEIRLAGPAFKVTINKGDMEQEIALEPLQGVERELESFAAAIIGKMDGLGDPRGALEDVAVIQAALESKGNQVDIRKLIGDL